MQFKTSSMEFTRFGSVYTNPIDLCKNELAYADFHQLHNCNINKLFHFPCEAYLELESGMAILLISEKPHSETLKSFSIHRNIIIRKNMYFALISVSPNINYKIIYEKPYKITNIPMEPAYIFEPIVPVVLVNEILGYFYNTRSSGYNFLGEQHNYYELTYVDRGSMTSCVNDKNYIIHERELMVYGPGQFHTQFIEEGNSCSYITIVFNMDILNYSSKNINYQVLLNRVFSYNKKLHTIISEFAKISDKGSPFTNSLLLCLLNEIILRLLDSDISNEQNLPPLSGDRQHFQDQELEEILVYIDNCIYHSITVDEICRTFSISRSFLQNLFNRNLNITPKKYINNLKLEKSSQLLLEKKYTISEIALMLGFNSIHHFSRAFSAKYNISPSEYSKKICI